jgi:predicted nucleic acid-binding protein
MGPLDLCGLERSALLLRDINPIVDWLDGRGSLADHFQPVFEKHAAGEVQFAITTVTIADVLTGPLRFGDEALTARYRGIFESWRVVDVTTAVAERAARLHATQRLKPADAVQAASAFAINADALVTHNRDFERFGPRLRIIA